MSLPHLGETRTRRAHDHLLQTPDTFVWTALPGMKNTTACVHCAPALGSDFTMYTAKLGTHGSLGPALGSRFIYVLDGSLLLQTDGREQTLAPGEYAFIPHTILIVL